MQSTVVANEIAIRLSGEEACTSLRLSAPLPSEIVRRKSSREELSKETSQGLQERGIDANVHLFSLGRLSIANVTRPSKMREDPIFSLTQTSSSGESCFLASEALFAKLSQAAKDARDNHSSFATTYIATTSPVCFEAAGKGGKVRVRYIGKLLGKNKGILNSAVKRAREELGVSTVHFEFTDMFDATFPTHNPEITKTSLLLLTVFLDSPRHTRVRSPSVGMRY